MTTSTTISKEFTQRFGKPDLLVRSPARINIIGEHTDYNDGFVLPAAVDYEIYFAMAVSKDGKSILVANDLNKEIRVDFAAEQLQQGNWSDFLVGIVAQLQAKSIKIGNINCLFGGNIPIGAGMSSSAAITTGFLFGLNQLFNLGLSRKDIALAAQATEHEFVGVNCGIMDQFAILNGEKEAALMLDCRSLEYKTVSMQFADYRWLLCDTRVSHSLAASAYNTRRQECEQGVSLLKAEFPDIKALRDADLAQIEAVKNKMTAAVYKRCRFVVEENQRVQQAVRAAETVDVEVLGRL
jgi:galactokinase